MKEAIREMFLTDWVKEATTNEIVEKLIEHDERGKEIERLNNIINELEKIIINEEKGFSKPVYISSQTLLNKIKELKGDSSNE